MAAPPVPDIAAGNETFSTQMRAFHAWEAGELSDALNAYESTRLLSTTATSTSSITIGTGDRTFTVPAGLGFVAGQSVNVVSTANPANSMSGFVKSYTSTTLVVTVISVTGSGTLASWAIALGLSGGGASLGTNTFTGAQNFAQGSDIASAATINLTTATGNVVTVTGTVATSAVILGVGMTRLVRAAAAWPLTYNATTNNITGGVSTVLAPGDHVFYHNIGGVVYGLIIKANGQAVSDFGEIKSFTAVANTPANAVTITIPAGTLDFRSTTLGIGTPVTRTIGSPISLVISNGSTLGASNGVASRIAVLAIDNAGTVEVAVVNMASGLNLDESGLISTTAEGGAGAADSVTTIYSTTARTNVAYRVIGYYDETQATAGTHISALTLVQGLGGNSNLPSNTIGVNQSWQDVTGSRVSGTVYTNSTGRPIMVSVEAIWSGAGVVVNGVNICSPGTTQSMGYSFIVPVGHTYSVTTTGIATWAELR